MYRFDAVKDSDAAGRENVTARQPLSAGRFAGESFNPRTGMPRVAVLRDLCSQIVEHAQACEDADLWHPN
jgi:hypothetical protein